MVKLSNKATNKFMGIDFFMTKNGQTLFILQGSLDSEQCSLTCFDLVHNEFAFYSTRDDDFPSDFGGEVEAEIRKELSLPVEYTCTNLVNFADNFNPVVVAKFTANKSEVTVLYEIECEEIEV